MNLDELNQSLTTGTKTLISELKIDSLSHEQLGFLFSLVVRSYMREFVLELIGLNASKSQQEKLDKMYQNGDLSESIDYANSFVDVSKAYSSAYQNIFHMLNSHIKNL